MIRSWLRSLRGDRDQRPAESARPAAAPPGPAVSAPDRPAGDVNPPPRPPGKLVMPGSGGRPFPCLVALAEAYGTAVPPGPPILLFGDSVSIRVADEDADKRDLGAMVRDGLAGTAEVLALGHSAFTPRIYERLLAAVLTLPSRPRMVVVPINIRCYSPQWDLNPGFQLDAQLQAIEGFIADPSAPIPVIPDLTASDTFYQSFDTIAVKCALSPLGTAGAFRAVSASKPRTPEEEEERARTIFAFHYACPPGPDHRLLRSLANLLRLARGAGIRPFVYATPINLEHGIRLLGPSLADAVGEAIARTRAVCTSFGEDLHDWTGRLPATALFRHQLATEHLNETGRRTLSDGLCEHIRSEASAGFLSPVPA